ncbi:MAG: hypothetical protein QG594_1255 [Bacteroidota bacterium]|nr:hypothetical protein [Bacteroidota bacterium]
MINLKEIEERLDFALAQETKETLTKWLLDERLKNISIEETAPLLLGFHCSSNIGLTNQYLPPTKKEVQEKSKTPQKSESFFYSFAL